MRLARAEVLLLRLVLFALGVLMATASRCSARFRRQVTRDVLIEISSADGASQHFRFHASTRALTLPRRSDGTPDCALRFGRARVALTTLLSPRATARLVEGMNTGDIRIEGSPVLLLWFQGLTGIVVPVGRRRFPGSPVPVGPREPERRLPYSRYITREPAVRELDRGWEEAWAARDRLLQLRAPRGEPLPPG